MNRDVVGGYNNRAMFPYDIHGYLITGVFLKKLVLNMDVSHIEMEYAVETTNIDAVIDLDEARHNNDPSITYIAYVKDRQATSACLYVYYIRDVGDLSDSVTYTSPALFVCMFSQVPSNSLDVHYNENDTRYTKREFYVNDPTRLFIERSLE